MPVVIPSSPSPPHGLRTLPLPGTLPPEGKPEPGEICLHSALLEAIAAVQPEIERRHHRLCVAPPLPSWTVAGEVDSLNEALLHLLIHACQEAGQGGRITVAAARQDARATLCFAYRAGPAASPVFVGPTGAGLALATPLLATYGGRLSEESDECGTGRRVLIVLPLRAWESARSAENAPAP